MAATRPILSLLICCLFFLGTTAITQQKISGTVSGENNIPLAGATIKVKGTNIVTTSLTDGSFIITVNSGHVLEITFVGYRTQQIKIENELSLKIILQTAIVSLDDVVVTGYTSQKIKEITGAVAIIKPNDLTAVPAGQIEQMLQGKVAGLNVINSGMPGGPSNVRLRGIGNFGDVTPLYIIDGVQGSYSAI